LGNSPIDSADGPERRRFGRRAVFKRATIVTDGGVETGCVVVDISADGARLKLSDPAIIPDRLGLMIEDDDFSVHCKVIRREDEHLAVHFIGSPRRLSWLRRRSGIAAKVADAVRKADK